MCGWREDKWIVAQLQIQRSPRHIRSELLCDAGFTANNYRLNASAKRKSRAVSAAAAASLRTSTGGACGADDERTDGAGFGLAIGFCAGLSTCLRSEASTSWHISSRGGQIYSSAGFECAISGNNAGMAMPIASSQLWLNFMVLNPLFDPLAQMRGSSVFI